jgi:hypothetical protein
LRDDERLQHAEAKGRRGQGLKFHGRDPSRVSSLSDLAAGVAWTDRRRR